MRCRKARDNLGLFLAGGLDEEMRSEVEEHLSACPGCRAHLEALSRVTGEVEEALRGVSARPALRERVMLQVRARPLPSRVRRREVPEVPVAADEVEQQMRSRTTAQLVMAAAVLLAVVVVWSLVPRRGGEEGGLVAKGARVEQVSFEVTVYNNGVALVRDVRRLRELRAGLNEVRFADVPARIDATSVAFTSRTDPAGTAVLDQNYEHDLAAPERILSRHLDRRIEVVTKRGEVEGGYLAGCDEDHLVLTGKPPGYRGGAPFSIDKPGSRGTRMLARREVSAIHLERLPEGLVTRPTLVWKVRARRAGDHETVVSYLTGGVGWRCNYVLLLRPGRMADLEGWVTIENRSGASFPRARLKLMAGDVRLLERTPPRPVEDENLRGGGVGGAFVEKPFFEYHLYTLKRPADLADRSVKQVKLVTARGVRVEREYVFEGGPKVEAWLKFRNAKENGLGVPLPGGIVRVVREERDGTPVLIGEQEIDHTPRDEEVRVLMGAARDVVGERRVVSETDLGRHTRRRTVRIQLRNHGTEGLPLAVRERFAGDWRITSSSHPFRKVDARTAEWSVAVPAGGSLAVTYTADEVGTAVPVPEPIPRRPPVRLPAPVRGGGFSGEVPHRSDSRAAPEGAR